MIFDGVENQDNCVTSKNATAGNVYKWFTQKESQPYCATIPNLGKTTVHFATGHGNGGCGSILLVRGANYRRSDNGAFANNSYVIQVQADTTSWSFETTASDILCPQANWKDHLTCGPSDSVCCHAGGGVVVPHIYKKQFTFDEVKSMNPQPGSCNS